MVKERFKVGDKALCKRASGRSILVNGTVYTVSEVDYSTNYPGIGLVETPNDGRWNEAIFDTVDTPQPATKFKVGDKVRCIDTKLLTRNLLVLDEIYTISYVFTVGANLMVRLKENPGPEFFARRFELVEEGNPLMAMVEKSKPTPPPQQVDWSKYTGLKKEQLESLYVK